MPVDRIEELGQKCLIISIQADFYNVEWLHSLFRNKQPHNMEKYI